MTLALCTSCSLTSIALIDGDQRVIWEQAEDAPRRAGGACLAMLRRCLDETNLVLGAIDLFAADVGPGSFTGVRVGVTMAKTFGFLHGKPVCGASAFDLIDPTGTVVVPSRRGEFFVREPGSSVTRTAVLPVGPFSGFGVDVQVQSYPQASGFARLIGHLERSAASEFLPEYLLEPSISVPKKPYALIVNERESAADQC